MKNEYVYESVEIEVIPLNSADILTSSSPFDGLAEKISDWTW